MTKSIFPLLFLLLISLLLPAQNQEQIYKVRFTDKQASPYSLSNPKAFLSQRAIERRIFQHIPIVESDLPINPEYIQQIEKTGAEIVYSSKWLNTIIVKVSNPEVIKSIRQKSFVDNVQASDYLFTKSHAKKEFFENEKIAPIPESTLSFYKNQPKSSIDYGVSGNQAQMIGVDQLHAMGFMGEGMTIAVIDAGFNRANIMQAFDSLRSNGQILGTYNFVEPGADVYDDYISYHGTMVLSTMAAWLPGQLIGTAPKASYWLLRSEDSNTEYLMEEYYWLSAAEYADSVGVDIINSSLGYTVFDNPDDSHTYSDMDGNTTIVTNAADMAASKGILVVNSAGNSGTGPWFYISAPADGDSVFTIGAVNSSGIYASFSSTGPTADGRIKPDVSAQGAAAVVANIPTGITTNSGTSFSSPIMAGAAACLWQSSPNNTNMELMQAIKLSASSASNPNNTIGWGIPNMFTAISLLSTVGIEQEEPFSGITVFPNPFSDRINIEVVVNQSLKAEVKLINSMGNEVAGMKDLELSKGKNMMALNQLSRLSKGIYMLQVSDGYFVTTQKIIK